MRRLAVLAVVVALLATGCDPTTGRPPGPGQPVPPYSHTVNPVTASSLGASWRPGCPVGPADLRLLRVKYWGYDGEVHAGGIVVHRTVASDVAAAFGRLYAARFQIRRIHPVSSYGGDDARSMAANNTSAFNCRAVTGGTSWSHHSYGTAIDVNPVQNPYVTSSGTVLPGAGRLWADRSLRAPGMIHPGSPAEQAFTSIGWSWGGRWTSVKDYQHFSLSGR